MPVSGSRHATTERHLESRSHRAASGYKWSKLRGSLGQEARRFIILAGKLYNMQPSVLFVRVIIPGTYTAPRFSRTNIYSILKPPMPATGSRKRSKPHNMTAIIVSIYTVFKVQGKAPASYVHDFPITLPLPIWHRT
jgi:hypothetical protein